MSTAQAMLCAVMRGDSLEWPPAADRTFNEAFLNVAKYHGVDSLVCHLLKSTAAWEELPDLVKDGLLQAMRISAANEMVRTMDLVALFEVLQSAGIPILLLKGGALSYTHYPKPYLRSRGDTDIFINPGDIQKIQGIFRDLGYQCRGQIYKCHQFNCSMENTAVVYDVHWRSSNLPQYARVISHEEGTMESVSIAALNGCPALSPENALLLACMHRAGNPRHDPNKLIWLYDIHLLILGMSEPALLRFAERAVKKDIQVVCLEAINKARSCFATPLPNDVLEKLSTVSDTGSIVRRFADSYFGLIIDDLRCLPDAKNRLGLIRELFLPTEQDLLKKYDKQNNYWVPVLYLRYILGGMMKRISLR